MNSTTLSCYIEDNIPEGTLCCVLDILRTHNSNVSSIVNATHHCFSDATINASGLHMEYLKIIFYYVLYCKNTYLPQCSDTIDLRCFNTTEAEYIVYMLFLVIVLLITLMGNILLILIILNTRALQQMTNSVFIVSLAVSDLLVGLFIIPIKLKNSYHNLHFCNTITLCRTYITIDNILFVASITNLFVLTVDRFLALQYSYSYHYIMDRKRAKYLTTGIWCYAICWGLASNVNWSTYSDPTSVITGALQCASNNKAYITVVFSFVFYLPAIFMAFIYAKTFQISRRHIGAITALSVPSSPAPLRDRDKKQHDKSGKFLSTEDEQFCPNPPSSPSHTVLYSRKEADIEIHKVCTNSILKLLNESQQSTNGTLVSKEEEERRKILKVIKTVATVFGCFLVCWFPISVFATGRAWSHNTFSTVHMWPHVLVAEILPVLNSTMNPMIYSIKNKVYIKALRKMVSEARHRLIEYMRK